MSRDLGLCDVRCLEFPGPMTQSARGPQAEGQQDRHPLPPAPRVLLPSCVVTGSAAINKLRERIKGFRRSSKEET